MGTTCQNGSQGSKTPHTQTPIPPFPFVTAMFARLLRSSSIAAAAPRTSSGHAVCVRSFSSAKKTPPLKMLVIDGKCMRSTVFFPCFFLFFVACKPADLRCFHLCFLRLLAGYSKEGRDDLVKGGASTAGTNGKFPHPSTIVRACFSPSLTQRAHTHTKGHLYRDMLNKCSPVGAVSDIVYPCDADFEQKLGNVQVNRSAPTKTLFLFL